MIINIRGANGAGKSELARRVMNRYPSKEPVYIEGRRRPIGYTCLIPEARPLWVVGHYERATGGADTFDSLDEIFAYVRTYADLDHDVLFEGVIVGCETRRLVELHRRYPVLAIALTSPLEMCLAGIQARRDARGDSRPINPKFVASKMRDENRQRLLLRDNGLDYRRLSRAEAEVAVVNALGLKESAVLA